MTIENWEEGTGETVRVVEVEKQATPTVAILALVFGIIGFVVWLIPFVGWLMFPFWISAIVMGFMGKKTVEGRGMAIAGIVLGLVPLVLSLMMMVGILLLMMGM